MRDWLDPEHIELPLRPRGIDGRQEVLFVIVITFLTWPCFYYTLIFQFVFEGNFAEESIGLFINAGRGKILVLLEVKPLHKLVISMQTPVLSEIPEKKIASNNSDLLPLCFVRGWVEWNVCWLDPRVHNSLFPRESRATSI